MKEYDFLISSDRNNISIIEKKIENLKNEFNIDENKFINIQIAVSEAMINAIVHGNKEDITKKVLIKIIIKERTIEIIIKDEGKGFNFEKIPDPTKDENILKEHGRGLHIIKSLSDHFKLKTGETGTEISIIFNK